MITDWESVIRRKVDQLVNLQIATLGQESPLTSAQLHDYRVRFETIQKLYIELDRIKRTELAIKFANAP